MKVHEAYSGSSIVAKLSTTVNVECVTIAVRLNGLPTEKIYDFKLDSIDAVTIQDAGILTDNTGNESASAMQTFVWPPLVFPNIGNWYIAVVPSKINFQNIRRVSTVHFDLVQE